MLKSRYSTNPKGVHQPGAFEIKCVTWTRQVEQGSTIKTDIHNKVADFALYDANLCCYRIVRELKYKSEDGESQNIEQNDWNLETELNTHAGGLHVTQRPS